MNKQFLTTRAILFVILIVIFLSIGQVSAFYFKKEVISEEGGFKIQLPDGFTEINKRTDVLNTNTISINMNQTMSASERGLCIISWGDMTEILKRINENEYYKRLGESIKNNPNDNIDKEIEFNSNSKKGVTYYFYEKYRSNNFYERRSYIINKNKIYQIMFLSNSKDEVMKKDIEEYFQSFQFLN